MYANPNPTHGITNGKLKLFELIFLLRYKAWTQKWHRRSNNSEQQNNELTEKETTEEQKQVVNMKHGEREGGERK